MPKVKATVLDTKAVDGKLLAEVQFNGRLPQKGELLTVKWGRHRSGLQNNFYWLYLTFLMNDCGLKDEYLNVDELHDTLKATFLSRRINRNGLEITKVGSTTELDKLAFGEYFDKIDKAMAEFHKIDTSAFWSEYEKFWKM